MSVAGSSPDQKRQKSGESSDTGSLIPELPSDVQEHILGLSSWADLWSHSLVCKSWCESIKKPALLERVALEQERRHTFLPHGFLQAYSTIHSQSLWQSFLETYLSCLQEFESLKDAMKDVDGVTEQMLMDNCELQAALPFGFSEGSIICPRSVEASPAEVAALEASGIPLDKLVPVLFLDCEALHQAGCISAFGLLPQVSLLLCSNDWRDGTFILCDNGDGPEVADEDFSTFYFPAVASGEFVQTRQLSDVAVRDYLFLNEGFLWKVDGASDVVDSWHSKRKGDFFRDGNCVRIGGSQVFDGQGNFVIDTDSERVIAQTSHPDGFLWGSFGFYIDRKEHASGNWSAAKHGVVDDA